MATHVCAHCGAAMNATAASCRTCGWAGTGGQPFPMDRGLARREPVGRLEGERVVFREWNLNEHLDLISTARDHQWTLEMEASCPNALMEVHKNWQSKRPARAEYADDPNHRSPNEDCGCGLHAFYDVPDGSRYAGEVNSVVGAIVVSGKVLLGPTGVRAQKARIVMLAYGNERQKVLAQGAAAKLGVGCCKLEDLERLSLEYGQLVPDNEKPQLEPDGPQAWGPVPSVVGIRMGGMTRQVQSRGSGSPAATYLSARSSRNRVCTAGHVSYVGVLNPSERK